MQVLKATGLEISDAQLDEIMMQSNLPTNRSFVGVHDFIRKVRVCVCVCTHKLYDVYTYIHM